MLAPMLLLDPRDRLEIYMLRFKYHRAFAKMTYQTSGGTLFERGQLNLCIAIVLVSGITSFEQSIIVGLQICPENVSGRNPGRTSL